MDEYQIVYLIYYISTTHLTDTRQAPILHTTTLPGQPPLAPVRFVIGAAEHASPPRVLVLVRGRGGIRGGRGVVDDRSGRNVTDLR